MQGISTLMLIRYLLKVVDIGILKNILFIGTADHIMRLTPP